LIFGRFFSASAVFSLAVSMALGVFLTPATSRADRIIGSRALSQSEKDRHPTIVIASQAALSDDGEHASLTLTLSEKVDLSAFVLSDPDRVILDLPTISFDFDPGLGKPPKAKHGAAKEAPPTLIGSFRFGSFAPGRSRIVLDLAGPARVTQSELVKTAESYQLVLQLEKTDRASFRATAQATRLKMAAEPAEDLSAKSVAISPSASALPRILIDPGHGGVDSGAMVGGLIEKNVVLEFAKLLAAKLRQTGRYDVVMTREDDTFVSLGDRVKIARAANAALFISIHADTLNEADVSGATVYTVSDKASDVQAARVADKENQSDSAAGVENDDAANGVNDILFDLTRRETKAYSHVFAHTLANYWKAAGRLNKNPERSAGFKVLTAPDVPSVLLELGYLSNDKDATALTSPVWREQATTQVSTAVETFFNTRTSAPKTAEPDGDKQRPTPSALTGQVKPVSFSDVTGTTH
jgi:N-acetylmuramoyl-L-alanine amidase